jgi:hypothetical protein
VWLGYNKATGKVDVAACANQDPLSTLGLVPLIGIDVWEHACEYFAATFCFYFSALLPPLLDFLQLCAHSTFHSLLMRHSPPPILLVILNHRLPAIQEHAPRLPKRHLVRDQLEGCREALGSSQVIKTIT